MIRWLLRLFRPKAASLQIYRMEISDMTITLVALAAAAHMHAVERDASGNVIAGESVTFVSSDESVFTATVNADNPLTVDLRGLKAGNAVLSVYDANRADLHVSFDVIVTPALAASLELDADDGTAQAQHVNAPPAADSSGNVSGDPAPASDADPVTTTAAPDAPAA